MASKLQLPSDPEWIVSDPWEKYANHPRLRRGPPGLRFIRLRPSCFILFTYHEPGCNLVAYGRYYEQDWPIQKQRAGALHLSVHPALQGRGIGTMLLDEMLTMWDIDFTKQQYSKQGFEFVKRYIERRTAK